MKKVVLVLELSEDEAELVLEAVSSTRVRFADLTLGELLGPTMQQVASVADGTQITHAKSEGATHLGGGMLDLSSLAKLSGHQRSST